MSNFFVASFRRALKLLRTHRSYLYTLALVILIPAAFLVSGQQFLTVAKERHVRTERARVGLLHDTLVAYYRETNSVEGLRRIVETIGAQNPDMVTVALVRSADDSTELLLGQSLEGTQYRDLLAPASIRTDESLIFDTYKEGEHYAVGVRAMHDEEGTHPRFLITVSSQTGSDTLYASRVRVAYIYLAGIIFLIVLLVVRHARIINYADLYAELRDALAAKTTFIHMTAHELRAPLSAMRGYASMIRETPGISAEVEKYAVRIEESSSYMVRLVSDMLDVAKIDSGGMALAHDTIVIRDVVATLCERLLPLAREHGLSLVQEEISDTLRITVDQTRFEQILTNLVSNALKYTKAGSVTLAATVVHGKCEIRIKDTGMGMTADDQHKLFAPFFRTEDAETSKETGTGLGMWLTKQFIEKMGGIVDVESIHGVGTHVVVVFPLAKA